VLPTFRLAPFVLVNPGLAGDDATMERKLRRYQNLLVLEVTDRPDNAGAWTSLGLQYANDGLIEKARECYRRALVADPTCFIATKELATDYMRQARVLTDACLAALPSAHPMRKVVEAQAQMLGQFAPDQPILGLARAGVTPENADVPLPPFDEARFVSRDSGNAGTDGVVR
jgi:tetratricopeptide (TPR) repeat protein